ncbi:hypothetical protein FOMA001_g17934 [Fusarium oxysporum f. sp. matthiolae]|nr:hypothetical protein FOMA001_g17934 [Fusarium oxysporum f. sp. matthiolae]
MVGDLTVNQKGNPSVAYFFCRYDVPDSLQARTILGSLARQLLSTVDNPISMLEDLTVTGIPDYNTSKILDLLKSTLKSTSKAYLVLDGLDECNERQREGVILCLWELQTIYPVLICLSFRQEAGNALARRFEKFVNPSKIDIPVDNPDIPEYIQFELERRVQSADLVVGNPALILEIRDALLENAQGRFLWVALQIESLCHERTDQSIRETLANFARDDPAAMLLETSQQTQPTLTALYTDSAYASASAMDMNSMWKNDDLMAAELSQGSVEQVTMQYPSLGHTPLPVSKTNSLPYKMRFFTCIVFDQK